MEIRYIKANPTGNITALVESFPPEKGRSAAAEAVFAADGSIEQLGFLCEKDGADIALDMAGGEFCGNATLCAAAYHLRRAGLQAATVRVAISGVGHSIDVEMKISGSGYTGRLDMPLPLGIEEIETEFGRASLVCFAGISHVIAPASLGRERAERLIVPLCSALKAEALGLMLYDEESESLSPLVYVPGAATLCWEHSCASGTSALGAWMAARRQSSCRLELEQPGGKLSISAEMTGGSVSRLRLDGRVEFEAEKSIKI